MVRERPLKGAGREGGRRHSRRTKGHAWIFRGGVREKASVRREKELKDAGCG